MNHLLHTNERRTTHRFLLFVLADLTHCHDVRLFSLVRLSDEMDGRPKKFESFLRCHAPVCQMSKDSTRVFHDVPVVQMRSCFLVDDADV